MKKYDYTTFNFKTVNGEDFVIHCYVYSTPSTWGHRCDAYINGVHYGEFKKVYLNRTWECFKFESLIYKVINSIYANKRDQVANEFLKKQVEAIACREREACQAWINSFQTVWNGLSDETKKTIQEKNIIVHTTEEADTVLAGLKVLKLLESK